MGNKTSYSKARTSSSKNKCFKTSRNKILSSRRMKSVASNSKRKSSNRHNNSSCKCNNCKLNKKPTNYQFKKVMLFNIYCIFIYLFFRRRQKEVHFVKETIDFPAITVPNSRPVEVRGRKCQRYSGHR